MLRKFEVDPEPIQQLLPAGELERFEGLGYSSSGLILAAATADSSRALLFRRGSNGLFENDAFCTLSGLRYPHDISFTSSGRPDLLAIAQREGAVAVYAEGAAAASYGPQPTFEIAGPESKLVFTDAVAFVPESDHLVACNLSSSTLSFYRIVSRSPLDIDSSPYFELTHGAMHHPDGLALSKNARWLATANHGANSITIFARQTDVSESPRYGPTPIAEIRDGDLCYPHSVAFTDNDHLVMTNAGANYIKVYRLTSRLDAFALEVESVLKMTVNDQSTFEKVNSQNKMEGGPKGLAIHRDEIALCSPEFGIKIYRFRELQGH